MTLAQSQRQSSVAVVVFYLQRCSFLRKTKRQTLICVIDDRGQPILLHCSRKIRSVLTIKKSLQLFFIFLGQPVERKQIERVNWSVKIERKNKDKKRFFPIRNYNRVYVFWTNFSALRVILLHSQSYLIFFWCTIRILLYFNPTKLIICSFSSTRGKFADRRKTNLKIMALALNYVV